MGNLFLYKHPFSSPLFPGVTVNGSADRATIGDMSQTKMPLLASIDREAIPALEADLAYFEARLSLLHGLPDSLYQRAQLRAYHALEQAVNATLGDLRARLEG